LQPDSILSIIKKIEQTLYIMNFQLNNIPERTTRPRSHGISMIMDKGSGMSNVKDFLDAAHSYIDIVKLGFGTSVVTQNLKAKLALYSEYNIPVYFGGTLFEAFLVRNQIDDYIAYLKDYGLTSVEVSDGSVSISHAEKCKHIERFANEGFTVYSEVGSKDAQHIMPPFKWIEQMENELNAGSSYVIAEAREAGNIGIYRDSGEVREGLIQEIIRKIPVEKIIWESPQKAQQVYFINLLGCNANLGNIAPSEIIALEAMRIGLRGDSFNFYL